MIIRFQLNIPYCVPVFRVSFFITIIETLLLEFNVEYYENDYK